MRDTLALQDAEVRTKRETFREPGKRKRSLPPGTWHLAFGIRHHTSYSGVLERFEVRGRIRGAEAAIVV